ncbi:LacI family transcriptional regulator [Bacillus timonensis]|nr:LacI family transcriptional regulator [Bacillus timonensis]
MATIEDVAKLAGLSRTTVSRVINHHPYVSDLKKKRVQEAMKELGYVPNSSAQNLRRQKTGMIAVLIPKVTNPFFSQLIESMEIAAAENNYQLIVCQTRYSAEKELSYLNLLKTKQVDGVILASIQNDWNMIQPFLQYGPIVLCNEYHDHANIPMVRLDQTYGAYLATTHLIQQGHTKIAYCCGEHDSHIAAYREAGFMKALLENSLSFDETYLFRSSVSIEAGKEIFLSIANDVKPPTAVFTGSDEVAAGIISEAKRHEWSIPEDIAVIGFDNQVITEIIEPSISTIHQPVEKIAMKSIEIMIEKISSKVYESNEVHEFPLQLIIRESTNRQEKGSLTR